MRGSAVSGCGGYFGVEYREKLRKTIRREIRKRKREVNLLPAGVWRPYGASPPAVRKAIPQSLRLRPYRCACPGICKRRGTGSYFIRPFPRRNEAGSHRHIELLKLDTQAIWDFEQAGPVSLSQQFGDQIFLQPSDDETSEQINRFEQKYECLVYHVLWADSPIAGECRSLLFISPASSDWNGERKFIESCGPVHAYVE